MRDSHVKIIIVTTILLITSCVPMPDKQENMGSGCGWGMAASDSPETFGAQDFNASYAGTIIPVKPGEKMVITGRFPHARYMTFVIYDQDFMPIDSIADYDIEPLTGKNPFRPGVDRSAPDLAEYELTVLMETPPDGERPTNTLYAGRANNGELNRVAVVTYRIYLPDKGMSGKDGQKSGIFAGADPQFVQLYEPDGEAYCPNPAFNRLRSYQILASILRENKDRLKDPTALFGGAQNPPVWINNASDQTQSQNTFVGNEETRYVFAPVSSRFGEVLVLRWKPPETPVDTFTGKPFPEDYDMRYWSLSFAYFDRMKPLVVYSEKTVADVEVPVRPDGKSQLVIGFNGIGRPDFVDPETWVGVSFDEGLIILRNIQIKPGHEGDFGKMEPGPVTGKNEAYTPGGVYCSIEELRANPGIGRRSRAIQALD